MTPVLFHAFLHIQRMSSEDVDAIPFCDRPLTAAITQFDISEDHAPLTLGLC